ncbi:MAG: hypothetical protein WKF37_08605 [Bryobacteraceae bacterium]
MAGDANGNIFNVNADQMAVSCASGFKAERLIFLTDVDGVRGPDSLILECITPADCARLIDEGVATGGMQAKLNAATNALESGIQEVVIAAGMLPGTIGQILAGKLIGTRLVGNAAHA